MHAAAHTHTQHARTYSPVLVAAVQRSRPRRQRSGPQAPHRQVPRFEGAAGGELSRRDKRLWLKPALHAAVVALMAGGRHWLRHSATVAAGAATAPCRWRVARMRVACRLLYVVRLHACLRGVSACKCKCCAANAAPPSMGNVPSCGALPCAGKAFHRRAHLMQCITVLGPSPHQDCSSCCFHWRTN